MFQIDKSKVPEITQPRNEIYYHALNYSIDYYAIKREGFRTETQDEDGRWFRDGNLGVGLYLTKNWKVTAIFGELLVDVEVQSGTKIIDASIKPKRRTLDYLIAEFGKEIVTSDSPLKVLPKNKKLKESELVELLRYQYCQAWEKDWGRSKEGYQKFPIKRIKHLDALNSCVSLLKKYKYHGFGNPQDDNGIIVFSADRVRLNRVIGEFKDKSKRKNGEFDLRFELLPSRIKT
jgi:hypothetical protein